LTAPASDSTVSPEVGGGTLGLRPTAAAVLPAVAGHTTGRVVMSGYDVRSLDKPDERREFDKGYVEVITSGNHSIGRSHV
jgi:hypothetical protein